MRSIRKRSEVVRRGAAVALCVLAPALACEQKARPPLGDRAKSIQHEQSPEPQYGGILRSAFYVDLRTLEPHTAFGVPEAAVNNLIFDKLIGYNDKAEIIPELAERFEQSPDGKRYTFFLRKGVKFHDGGLFKADDVKRSIERSLHPNTPNPAASFYNRIAGFDAYTKGKASELRGVKVIDDYTVAIDLSEPDSTFLHVMAMDFMAPVCGSAGRVWTRDFGGKPCGTGPFKMHSYKTGRFAKVRRFDQYWDPKKPYLDGVDWFLTVQKPTQRFKFEAGEIDISFDLGVMDTILFRQSREWDGLWAWQPAMTTYGIFMNTEMPPFNNRHIRRAVSFAIDRVQAAAPLTDMLKPWYKVVPGALIPATEGYPQQRYDYKQALEEMRLGGYPYDPETGEGGYPEEIVFFDVGGSSTSRADEIYQQQLAKIGIRVRIQQVGWPTFLARRERSKTVAMGRVGWHADFPEAVSFFEPILTSRAINRGSGKSQNAAFFDHPEFDDVVARARTTVDDEERARLYRRAEEIIVEEAPWAVVFVQGNFEIWQPYVHGYHPHPFLSYDVRDVWLDLKARDAAEKAR